MHQKLETVLKKINEIAIMPTGIWYKNITDIRNQDIQAPTIRNYW